VTVDATRMLTDFVCIPRPIEPAATPDGGPLRYRVRHEVPLWRPGERPQMRQMLIQGAVSLALQPGAASLQPPVRELGL
jgi:alkaline phosphatase D